MLRISNFFFLGLFILIVSCFDPPEDALDPESVNIWEYYSTSDGLANNTVWSMRRDNLGNIWCGTFGGGVSKYDGNSWVTYDTGDGLIDDYVLSIYQDKDRNMWFGTTGGFSIYDGNDWASIATIGGYSVEVYAIVQDSDDTYWLGTSNLGIILLEETAYYQYWDYNCFECNVIYELYKDSDQNIWIGTEGGLKKWDGKNITLYTTDDGLPANDVWSIYEDSSGDLWIGTFSGDNVARLRGNRFEEVSLYNGLPINPVLSIVEDSHGNMWFGTYGAGVIKYDRVLMRTLKEGQGPGENIIYSSTVDLYGNVWLGHDEAGVSKYIPK